MPDDDLSDRLREIEDRMRVSVLFSIEDRQTILDAVRRIEDLLEATNWFREQYEDAEAEVEKQADRLEAAEEGLRTVIGRAEGWERHYVDPGEETVARELRGIAENALRGEGGDEDD